MRKSKKYLMNFTLAIMIITSIPVGKIVLDGYSKYKKVVANIGIEEKVSYIKNNENYVEIEKIDKDFLNAIVSVEDHRFYSHNGLDYISIIRATINNIQQGKIVQGGSTITQQLAKNIFLNGTKDFSRKVAEVFLVNDLEKKYSKDEILELYVNVINYGNGYKGIQEASNGYFNQTAKDLSYEDAAMLAGLPQCPEGYNPVKYYEKASYRQKQVFEAIDRYGNKEYNDEYYLLSVDVKCVL